MDMKQIMTLPLPVLLAHAARTSSEDPLQQFKFRVTIPGIPTTIGFQKVSGLSEEVGVVEYDESGYDYTHKLPGKVTVGEVIKSTITNPDFRKTIIIQLCDRFGNPKRTWKLAEAWASKWEGADLDATGEDVAIETVTIQHEYFL